MTAPAVRPCGCPPDAPDHLDPEPDWIGDTPIMHGERDHDPRPHTERWRWNACLCGHPEYGTCPETWGGSLADLTIRPADPS